MLKARLEGARRTAVGPLINLNIYNDDKIEYSAAIITNGSHFTCYRMDTETGVITQSAIGFSGAMNYNKLVMSNLTETKKKAVLHGEIIIAVIEFIAVIADLFNEDIECPYGVSRRFMSEALKEYIDMCYEYFML